MPRGSGAELNAQPVSTLLGHASAFPTLSLRYSRRQKINFDFGLPVRQVSSPWPKVLSSIYFPTPFCSNLLVIQNKVASVDSQRSVQAMS